MDPPKEAKTGFCPWDQLPREIRRANARTTVWGWFKGGLDGGEWGGGFYVTDNAEQEEAVTLQHGDFKECMVPNWLICDKKLTDRRKALPFLQATSGSSAVKHILHEKFHLPVVIL